MFQLSR